MDYKKGFEFLREVICGEHAQVDVLEARLLENLDRDRRYGSTEALRSDRAAIIDELNRLCRVATGRRTSFNEACSGSLSTSVSSGPVDVAIVTVLSEEYDAVISGLKEVRLAEGSGINTHAWRVGRVASRVHGAPYQVVVALAGRPGTVSGALATVATVRRWRPRYLLLVGIAGGLERSLERGDIVISSSIWGYEYGKIEKRFLPRPDQFFQVDGGLLRAALALSGDGAWREGVNSKGERSARPPAVKSGLVASGEKVVDDPDEPFFAAVLEASPRIAAVEMEGGGAAAAIAELAAEGSATGFLMIRGISDLPPRGGAPRGAQSAERDSWKQAAARNAAAFAVHLIEAGWPTPPFRESS